MNYQAVLSSGYTHRQVMGVVSGVVLCVLMAALDQTVVIPAVPTIAAELHGFSNLSWLVTAYMLTSTASAPILGRLSDQFGRRRVIMAAQIAFVTASLLCGSVHSVLALILCRGLQGIGGGGLISLAQTALADVVSPRERARYQPYMVTMWAIASTAGPMVGGWVTQHASWRWVFWMNLPLGALALVLCYRGLAILPRRRAGGRLDGLGIVLLTVAVAAVLMVISSSSLAAWFSRRSLLLLALATITAGVLVWHQRRIADPLLPPRLFANRECFGSILVAALASVHNMAAAFLLPLYFQLALGLSPAASGVMMMPNLIAITIAAYVCGFVARRTGQLKPMLLVGTSLCLVSFAAMLLLGPAQGLGLFLAASVTLGLGLGLTFATLMVWVQNAADPRDVGIALGTQLLLRSLGAAFGSAVSGALLIGYFNRCINAAGLASVRLEQLRNGGSALLGAHRALVLNGVTAGFHAAFALCALLALVAVLLVLRLQDLPLRTRVVALAINEQG